ncbi:MAG: UDP-N-acetylmuramoyl-L-alanyl-D-glutamate--2,6-diaminopimelate ligase [Lachnospiraceae bacterium]|nr:UDP-N-acetylmuramoyl-L-alanyl-D-glutamate--2,6-diaminopimelate ligase [Lachnospiraceae bacterium]
MKLKELMRGVEVLHLNGSEDTEITEIVYDSRKVSKGCLFVCIKGFKVDGHVYLDGAIEAGAAAILVEDLPEAEKDAAIIQVPDTRKAMAVMSANFFGNPAEKLTVVGLTGTKGKTTTTHMMKAMLEDAGHKVGMIGTLGAYVGSEKLPTKNTTPESHELHRLFAQMVEAGCSYVVMEVSSQAFKLDRVYGITFDYGLFLNISHDHIGAGEHADFAEYFGCKKEIFKNSKMTIINGDDALVAEAAGAVKNVVTVSCKKEADYYASSMQNTWTDGMLGVEFTVAGKADFTARLSMPGIYNVANALSAIAFAKEAGIPESAIISGLARTFVKGRTQVMKETAHFATFIIDYAHNELSTESLLTTLQEYKPKRLICLFGGGGNRDRMRRVDMGRVAAKYADLIVLTMDNPRDEEVEHINQDIIEGINVHQGKYETIIDREEAIKHLIEISQPGDIVALLGKGHEEYQEIKGVKYHFSEEEVIKKYAPLRESHV